MSEKTMDTTVATPLEILEAVERQNEQQQTVSPAPAPSQIPTPLPPPSTQDEMIRVATEAAIKEMYRRDEEQRMQQRGSNPAFVAEDLIMETDLPEDCKAGAMDYIQDFLEDDPKTDVATIQRVTKAYLRRTEKELAKFQDITTGRRDLKSGAMMRKYGEASGEILEQMEGHYESLGMAKTLLKEHLERMDHSEFLKTVDAFYQGPYRTGVAQKAANPTKSAQEVVEIDNLKNIWERLARDKRH